MNPGLVVKLRPAGPWRIGPDSGARNRVDVIYHSDSLYSAVTSAMSRMGSLDAWLDATARSQTPAVCFSSCFPFLDDLAFVVPPRTIWPPTSPAAMSARVRWKSARFIPLTVVESMLEGRKLNENQWSVDGASGCLVPAGKPGPFRTGVRWNAAVDRLSGASERHATACIEFREGCGLWTVVGFRDDASRDQWQDPVKAAFRLLADTGFGGERSRGWGRAETPEFVEGTLPGLIIEYRQKAASSAPQVDDLPAEELPQASGPVPPPPVEEPPAEQPPVTEPPDDEEPAPVPPVEGQAASAEPEAPAPVAEVAAPAVEPEASVVEAAAPVAEAPAPPVEPETPAVEAAPEAEAPATPAEPETSVVEAAAPEAEAPAPPVEPETPAPVVEAVAPEGAPDAPEAAAPEAEPAAPIAAAVRTPDRSEPMRAVSEREPAPTVPAVSLQAHWLLSLFTPATGDAVDWGRGSYSVLARGGRIESPSLGSGELKKQIQMVAEGSVLYSDGVPLGSAANVAPDGFAHPVFRAGFALAIPLPEVH